MIVFLRFGIDTARYGRLLREDRGMIWKQFQETRNENTNLSRTSPVPTWTCALSVFSVVSVGQTLLDWPGLAAIPQWPESHPRCGFRCAPPLLSGTGGNWDWPPLTQVRKATETQRKAHADASSHSLRPFYLGTDCTLSRSGAKLGFNGSDFCSLSHTQLLWTPYSVSRTLNLPVASARLRGL